MSEKGAVEIYCEHEGQELWNYVENYAEVQLSNAKYDGVFVLPWQKITVLAQTMCKTSYLSTFKRLKR